MSSDTLLVALVAIVMVIGVAGTVLPILPGLWVIWAAAVAYGLFAGFGIGGWIALALITFVVWLAVGEGVRGDWGNSSFLVIQRTTRGYCVTQYAWVAMYENHS